MMMWLTSLGYAWLGCKMEVLSKRGRLRLFINAQISLCLVEGISDEERRQRIIYLGSLNAKERHYGQADTMSTQNNSRR